MAQVSLESKHLLPMQIRAAKSLLKTQSLCADFTFLLQFIQFFSLFSILFFLRIITLLCYFMYSTLGQLWLLKTYFIHKVELNLFFFQKVIICLRAIVTNQYDF